jgi:hypothetical protein
MTSSSLNILKDAKHSMLMSFPNLKFVVCTPIWLYYTYNQLLWYYLLLVNSLSRPFPMFTIFLNNMFLKII